MKRFIVCLWSILVCTVGLAQTTPYFPERGDTAAFQRASEALNGCIVMLVSLEPGQEDLPAVAYVRLGLGARVVSVYVTNGGATPSDFSGEAPFLVAGRRKEEAFRASTYLGANAHFLNLPDMGILANRQRLAEFWDPDTLYARVMDAVIQYRPDVIVLARDLRNGRGETMRWKAVRDGVVRAVTHFATSPVQIVPGSVRWKIQRVLADLGKDRQRCVFPVDRRHEIWGKSYREIGGEAARAYRTLRAQQQLWLAGGERSYTEIFPVRAAPAGSLLEGLVMSSPRLQRFESMVRKAAAMVRRSRDERSLRSVAATIDSLDLLLGSSMSVMTDFEKRVAGGWKRALENARCAMLGIDVKMDISDSLLTDAQVFVLNYQGIAGRITGGSTQIYFPDVLRHGWAVNASETYQWPLDSPRVFTVLTPEHVEHNWPAETFGLERPTLETAFTYIVTHKDSVRTHSFSYRKDVPLRVGPLHHAEVYTPIVLMTPGEYLVYALANLSREGLEGDVSLQDSVVVPVKRHFLLPTKDSFLVDTLYPVWKNAPPGDYGIDLRVLRQKTVRFIARNFNASVDTTRTVGIITGIEASPVWEALRRLHVPTRVLDSASLMQGRLDGLSVIVLDREAGALRPDLRASIPAIRSWLQAGGHVVILPQLCSAEEKWNPRPGASFRAWQALDPGSQLSVEESHALFTAPNMIGHEDWEGWVVSRALCALSVRGPCEMLVRARGSGAPLLATMNEGKGRVTYVALDISSQLVNVHPGAYRIMANIISHP